MKIGTLVLLAVLFVGFNSQPSVKRLMGRWEVYKIEKIDKHPIEKRRKYVEFKDDGTFVGGRIGGNSVKMGTWNLNKDTKVLTLKSNEGNKDDGDYNVIKLTHNKLIIELDATVIHLDRGKKVRNSK